MPNKHGVCLSGYLFTSMHLSQMASAIGLLRKMEGELEKQTCIYLVASDHSQAQHAQQCYSLRDTSMN